MGAVETAVAVGLAEVAVAGGLVVGGLPLRLVAAARWDVVAPVREVLPVGLIPARLVGAPLGLGLRREDGRAVVDVVGLLVAVRDRAARAETPADVVP